MTNTTDTPSETKTLDQQRAKHAWDVVQDVIKDPKKKEKAKEFGTQVKKMPMRITAAGLGQALAFLEAKDYAQDLRQALTDWIHKRRFSKEEKKSLLERVIHGNADFQRYATAECLAYLVWLVRFADAEKLTDSSND